MSGLCAGLIFASLHALIIVPIWSRMAGGLFGATLAGAGIAWAYGEIERARGPREYAPGLRASMWKGARFGALLWLAVVPVTGVDVVLRMTGVAPRYEMVAVVVAVVVALAGGWVLGDRLAGTRRARVATAVAALLLTVAMVGPVPVANSGRALGIFLAVLPACVVGGAILGSLARFLRLTQLARRE